MNIIMFTHPALSAALMLIGCALGGFFLGAPLWILLGRAWSQKKEPAAWNEARQYKKIAERKTVESLRLKAKLKAVVLAATGEA